MGIGLGTVVLWGLPFGTYLLWPFTILSTWYHEMGHGLTAILLGGSFHKLEIYADGSGLATHQGDLWFGRFGRAMVAAGGLIAPSIVGGILILASRSVRATRWCLFGLGLMQVLSVGLWVRGIVGSVVLLLLSLLFIGDCLRDAFDTREH